jgi:polysaccharide pyruvyl transferase CsaB
VNALLLGYYGAKNLGDDLMLHCLLRWLGNRDVRVTVVSENPPETEARFGVPVVENSALLGQWNCWQSWFGGKGARLVSALRHADALVVGGGDLIRDDQGWKVFTYTIEKIVVAMMANKPVFLVNIGITPPRTKWGRWTLRLILRRCSHVIARDPGSLGVCQTLGAGDRATLVPDIVLTLPGVIGSGRPPAAAGRPYMLVCLRKEPNDFGAYPFGDAQVEALARALDTVATACDVDVRFVPFQSERQNDDNIIHQKILDRMCQKSRARLEPWCSSLESLSELFRNASCVIGMRLHAAVLGVALDRPVVVMPYDRKVWEFADLVNVRWRISSKMSTDSSFMASALREAMSGESLDYRRIGLDDWDRLTLEATAGAEGRP